jgi:geranylgeranyl reductase family protein
VGGGPVGGYTASKIAEKKFRVGIFEKRKEVGIPLNCAGLVTERVFEFLDVPKNKIIQNKVKGANIHSPSDNILSIGGGRTYALVIDRTLFDREIINHSEKKGADLHLENNVLAVQRSKDCIELKTSQNLDVKCKLLIGADGPFSKMRDRFAFSEPQEYLRGIGAEVTNVSLDPDFVEIFIGNSIAPGFFAWIIPINKEGTEARIGLCTIQEAPYSPKHYFSIFLKHKNTLKILKDYKITKDIAGVIPLGVLKKTYAPNVMLVGDAAAQVKPTSGGGIYSGLLCGSHCSKVAIDALENNDCSIQILKKYQKLWVKDLGRELNLGMKFRTVFKKLSDNHMDKYLEKFQNPKIIDIINQYGDIDYPSKLVKPVLKKAPTFIKLIPKIIKS